MKAVADVGFADRAILRDTLLLTLAKSAGRKAGARRLLRPVLQPAGSERRDRAGGCASRTSRTVRIRAPANAQPGGDAGAPAPELGELAQMLLSQDRNAIAAAMANAANAASLSDIRYFTQRGIFSTRILEQLGIERLRDDLDALTATNPAEAERLAAALDGVARKRARRRLAGAAALRARGKRKPAQRNPAQRAARRGSNAGRSSR